MLPNSYFNVFYILIAVLLFVFLKWFLKRFIKKEKTRLLVSILAAIVLTHVLYTGFIYLFIFSITYEPKQDFNKVKWMSQKNVRWQMAEDLVSKKILIGKDTTDLKTLIGEPSTRDLRYAHWQYSLGNGGGGLGFKMHFLNIHLTGDRVDSVKYFSQVD